MNNPLVSSQQDWYAQQPLNLGYMKFEMIDGSLLNTFVPNPLFLKEDLVAKILSLYSEIIRLHC